MGLIGRLPPGTIVDVGTNWGSKTEIFRLLASHTVAIEPDRRSAEILRTRFRWRSDVVVRECAITQKPGRLAFYQFSPGSAFNTANAEWATCMVDGSNHMGLKLPQPTVVHVTAATLDDIVSEFSPVKYVKIDVEGHELHVLESLHAPISLISLEFNLPQMKDVLVGCVEHLEKIGTYRFNAAISEPPHRLQFDRWLSGPETLTAIFAAELLYVELYAKLD